MVPSDPASRPSKSVSRRCDLPGVPTTHASPVACYHNHVGHGVTTSHSNSSPISCMRTGLCRMRTESLAAPCPRSGKRISGARDERPQTTSARSSFAAETARPVFEPRKRPQIGGYSSETRKRRFAPDCVVGPEGLEPPSISLWAKTLCSRCIGETLPSSETGRLGRRRCKRRGPRPRRSSNHARKEPC